MNNDLKSILVATPVDLEEADTGLLYEALRHLRGEVRSTADKNRRNAEEQFCYISRELEIREVNRHSRKNNG